MHPIPGTITDPRMDALVLTREELENRYVHSQRRVRDLEHRLDEERKKREELGHRLEQAKGAWD